MYRTLESARIVASLELLERRISERFPGAGLARVCGELTGVARETQARVKAIEQSNLPLRVGVLVLLGSCALLLAKVARQIDFSRTSADSVYSVLQGIEATMNILVLMGAAVAFLVTFELRLKRRRALTAIHELRSIAHVIDMHQLTKDPSSMSSSDRDTPSSPARTLTPYLLSRYLDYCSEMLALTAKVAALYAQSMPDPVVAEAANALEQLATNLSGKIWQKIGITERLIASAPTTSVPAIPLRREPPDPGTPPAAGAAASKAG
jgi:hypothetical protein